MQSTFGIDYYYSHTVSSNFKFKLENIPTTWDLSDIRIIEKQFLSQDFK